MNVRVGMDVEFAILDQSGCVVPAYLFTGADKKTKDKPMLSEFITYHADGCAIEIGSTKPFDTAKEMLEQTITGKSLLRDLLEGQGYELADFTSVYSLSEDVLKDPRASIFGCDKDRDAYTNSFRDPITRDILGNQGTLAGHIHFEYDKTKVPPHIMCRFLDTVFRNYLANAPRDIRRLTYGLPGIYREKPYGIEYRSPNNSWSDSSINTVLLSLAQDVVATVVEDIACAKRFFTAVDWDAFRKTITDGLPYCYFEQGEFESAILQISGSKLEEIISKSWRE